mmetsp:Transcript_123905/g.358338  ORF Transcript_123905/g.358338 Transcript_123905/m.358338 type:complete len:241 (-) Transcript_123905:186-908(-)
MPPRPNTKWTKGCEHASKPMELPKCMSRAQAFIWCLAVPATMTISRSPTAKMHSMASAGGLAPNAICCSGSGGSKAARVSCTYCCNAIRVTMAVIPTSTNASVEVMYMSEMCQFSNTPKNVPISAAGTTNLQTSMSMVEPSVPRPLLRRLTSRDATAPKNTIALDIGMASWGVSLPATKSTATKTPPPPTPAAAQNIPEKKSMKQHIGTSPPPKRSHRGSQSGCGGPGSWCPSRPSSSAP